MKIRIGLNSYKVAQLMKDISAEAAEDGTAAVKYKEIVSMPDVQNIDLTARSQSADVDADDISTTLSKCSGYDGKVQRTAFTPIDQAMLLGETILEDGTVVSSPKDEAPEFATGFICPVHGGSFLAMWVLRCKYATPDFSAETAGTEKLNPQSDTISFKSSSRASDDKWRVYKLCQTTKEAREFLTLETLEKLYESAALAPSESETPTAPSGTDESAGE